MSKKSFMIGQCVIYHDVICTVCAPEGRYIVSELDVWIDNPEKGHKHYVSKSNLKPLPKGQL